MRAFVFCLVIAVIAGLGRRWHLRIMLLALACVPASLVAFSRVYLTAHWPTDVLAGALLSVFSCSAALALFRPQPVAALNQRFWFSQACLAGNTCSLCSGSFRPQPLNTTCFQPEFFGYDCSRFSPALLIEWRALFKMAVPDHHCPIGQLGMACRQHDVRV